MTIRTRLTLWYAAILCLSTLLVAGLSYQEFVREKQLAAQDGAPEEEGEQDGWEDAVKIAFCCGVPAALLGLGGGWWLMRKALAPVAAITSAAAQMTEKNLRQNLPRSGNGDELDKLAEVLNAMIARLDGSFQRIREFTLHASHELKTPLTVMRGELETTLRDEVLSAPQRDRLLSQIDEIERLAKIVDGLTLLTKADAGQIKLNNQPLPLNELVRDSYEDACILAEPRQISVCCESLESLTITGDRHRLRQLLLNLTDNAIKYNRTSGSVTISLKRLGDWAEIKIANTGPGIPPEALPRVFDRFFRADASHSQSVEGCGLGLSIAQWIVCAHGGTIELASEPGKWTCATLRLPLRQP